MLLNSKLALIAPVADTLSNASFIFTVTVLIAPVPARLAVTRSVMSISKPPAATA